MCDVRHSNKAMPPVEELKVTREYLYGCLAHPSDVASRLS